MDTLSSLAKQVRQVAGFHTQSDEDIIKLGLLELLCCQAGCCNCPGPDIEFLILDLEQDG